MFFYRNRYSIFPGFLIGFVFFFIAALLVQLLWNWLFPVLFALPEINYLQALGIMFLSRLILGFRIKGPVFGNRYDWHKRWRSKFDERWEERFEKKFEEHFKKKWEDKDRRD